VNEQGVFERLKARGEELFSQVSGELMANPRFMQAMQRAFEGKQKLDRAAARALKQMNIPTRTEFKRALSRIEELERQIAELKPKRPTARKAPARKAPAKRAARRTTRSKE
jgi:polyhydroxyalkanoate synthesis regulator phasin